MRTVGIQRMEVSEDERSWRVGLMLLVQTRRHEHCALLFRNLLFFTSNKRTAERAISHENEGKRYLIYAAFDLTSQLYLCVLDRTRNDVRRRRISQAVFLRLAKHANFICSF